MSSQFGPYWMLRRIGLGDLAEVFVALRAEGSAEPPPAADDGHSAQLMAVKRIWREMANYDEIHLLLEKEGELAAQLVHPNVVRVHDVGSVGGRPYIAMEYVPGCDLARLIERAQPGRLAPGPAIRAILDICAALEYVHHARDRNGRPLRVVHGDVTPTNILVSTRGVAKLIDFSVAVSDIDGSTDDAAADTARPTVRGTYAYMSPEQARGEPIDQRTDVFALGVVLWELLANRRLFRRNANYLTLAAVVEDEVPRLADLDGVELGDHVGELDRILARALAKRREQRFDSISQLESELRPLAESLGWDLRTWTLQTMVRDLLSV